MQLQEILDCLRYADIDHPNGQTIKKEELIVNHFKKKINAKDRQAILSLLKKDTFLDILDFLVSLEAFSLLEQQHTGEKPKTYSDFRNDLIYLIKTLD